MTVRQLPGILKARWPEIEHQLLQGRYQPQPVRRVQIPKPAGGTRDLGYSGFRTDDNKPVHARPETDCRPGSESTPAAIGQPVHAPARLGCSLRRARRIAGGQMVNPVRQLSPRHPYLLLSRDHGWHRLASHSATSSCLGRPTSPASAWTRSRSLLGCPGLAQCVVHGALARPAGSAADGWRYGAGGDLRWGRGANPRRRRNPHDAREGARWRCAATPG